MNLQYVQQYKEEGNASALKGYYGEAIHAYSDGLYYLAVMEEDARNEANKVRQRWPRRCRPWQESRAVCRAVVGESGVLVCVCWCGGQVEEPTPAVKEMRASLLCNRAACYLRTRVFSKCIMVREAGREGG